MVLVTYIVEVNHEKACGAYALRKNAPSTSHPLALRDTRDWIDEMVKILRGDLTKSA